MARWQGREVSCVAKTRAAEHRGAGGFSAEWSDDTDDEIRPCVVRGRLEAGPMGV